MRQFYRGRPRCEAADCSRRLSTARAASARPGRPATAVWGSPLPAPMLSNDIIHLGTSVMFTAINTFDTEVGNLVASCAICTQPIQRQHSAKESLNRLPPALIIGEQRRTNLNVEISMV